MIIAVTSQNDEIFQHFGKTPQFNLFEIEDSSIKNSREIDTSESGHSALIDILVANSVNILICGGIGGGAVEGLKSAGIEVVSGVTGSVKEAVTQYLSGKNIGSSNATCDHHADHTCGEHNTCGEHTCH